jgi:Uma2 family endonuclease
MNQLQTQVKTDTWITTTWDEYLQILEQPDLTKVRSYYYNQQMRIEMSPVGADHADDNGIIVILINLWGMLQEISMRLLVNCSYRKTGIREAQPDVSYYIGEQVKLAPRGSSIVNLEQNLPPDLVIEIADSSLGDDLGQKRILYEDLGVKEYWVVDVTTAQIIAFKILSNCGSERITESEILPRFKIALLEEGLKRSRQQDNTEVGNWFMAKIRT